MINQNLPVTVAFGVDTAYAPHLAAAIASIVANAPGANLHFIVINGGIADGDRRNIEAMAPGQRFDWPVLQNKGGFDEPVADHISAASFYRLTIPQFTPPGVARVVYLDADLVVLDDIRELAALDMGKAALGAVFDPAVDAEEFAGRFGLPSRRLGYFNSGVLVLDIEKIRASKAFEATAEFAVNQNARLRFGDQDALNYFFWNDWFRLDPTWNTQRRMIAKDGRPLYATAREMRIAYRPRIIHFTEEIKPWSNGGYHPYIWTYYRYLKRTPYWDSVNKNAGTTPLRQAARRVRTFLKMARLKAN